MDSVVAAAPERLFEDTRLLHRFVLQHAPVTILSGAGISAASGIPEYRDDDGNWKHQQPMQFADFKGHAHKRQKYWARSYAGWQRISTARPNAAHRALAKLERLGYVHAIITQNVDDLHRRAGNHNVIHLHGNLRQTLCLDCDRRTPRQDFQSRLERANPGWDAGVAALAPDGDARLTVPDLTEFRVPDCATCGGIVKPDVVFFGEAVPQDRIGAAGEAIAKSEALLVVGSSLMVFSGYRFVRSAAESGKPIAIVNRGITRADALADHKLSADCTLLLPRLADSLNG